MTRLHSRPSARLPALFAALLWATCLSLPAAAQNATPSSAESPTEQAAHAKAIRDALVALNPDLPISRERMIKLYAGNDPSQMEVAARFIDEEFPGWWIEQCRIESARLWMPYITRQNAEAVTRWVATPAGRIAVEKGAGAVPASPVVDGADDGRAATLPFATAMTQYGAQISPQSDALINAAIRDRLYDRIHESIDRVAQWSDDRIEAETHKMFAGTSTLPGLDQRSVIYAYATHTLKALLARADARYAQLRQIRNEAGARAQTGKQTNQVQRDYFRAWAKVGPEFMPQFEEMANNMTNYAAAIDAPKALRQNWQNEVQQFTQRMLTHFRQSNERTNGIANAECDVADFMDRAKSRSTYANGTLTFADPGENRQFHALADRVEQLRAEDRRKNTEFSSQGFDPTRP